MVGADVSTAYMMSQNGEKAYAELLAKLNDLLAKGINPTALARTIAEITYREIAGPHMVMVTNPTGFTRALLAAINPPAP